MFEDNDDFSNVPWLIDELVIAQTKYFISHDIVSDERKNYIFMSYNQTK